MLLERGIARLNLAEVAERAAVTRVTVYRYFGDKAGLIREVCLGIARLFQRAAESQPDDSMREVNERLDRLGAELGRFPRGNLLARLEEIHRAYPEVYAEFFQRRKEAVDGIFSQALSAAAREGALREDLNLEVLKTIFWAAVVGLLENPALISSNVPLGEIFATVTEVFRHGILKEQRG